jgi:site-specific recombinase XerD
MYNASLDKAELSLKKSSIGERNKELILRFKDHCLSRGLSESRIIKYISLLKRIARMLGKDFDLATKEDIERVVAEISTSTLSEHSKQNLRVAIKKFYRWIYGLPKGKNPEITDWISTSLRKNNQKLPEDMLSEEEVMRMIEATPITRDKAIIALLWDTGLRIGELGSLKIKNVKFDDYGAILIVKGKSGARRVRTILSTSYLTNWLEEHPFKDNPDAPLWVKLGIDGDNGPMNYYGIRKQIITAAKKAGVKKRIHPHLFRHSRATYMAKYLTEAQMKEYFGWVQSSDMASVYVHLSGRDVDDAILRMHGLKKEEEEDKPKARRCPRCRKVNGLQAKFCYNCGAPLDVEVMIELEKSIAELGKGFGGLASTKPEMLKDMVEFLRVIELFSKKPALLEEAKKFIVQMERKGQAVSSK